MRAVVVIAIVAAASPAHASAQPRPRAAPADPSFAHLIFLNRCAAGCTVTPGDDDARVDHSTVPQQVSTIPPYPWGDDSWRQLVQCVAATYAPFAITITDVDPGDAPHFELMVGGHDTDVQVTGALGVAPFIPCGGVYDDVITFVFAAETADVDVLCWAAAQETSHVLGLDHELDADDPMTYLYPPYKKTFQNHDASCGEDVPRTCACGGATQNTVRFLAGLLGEASPTAPSLTVTAPRNGAWVPATFRVSADVTSVSDVASVTAAIDGAAAGTATAAPWRLDVTAPPGAHEVEVRATNAAARSTSAQVQVHVMASCGAGCADGTLCLAGSCVPDASTAGGLGAPCTPATPCAIGACDVGAGVCAAPCDPGDACPAGFACGDGECVPVRGGGGCDAGGGEPLALLGIVPFVVRRRRRRAA